MKLYTYWVAFPVACMLPDEDDYMHLKGLCEGKLG